MPAKLPKGWVKTTLGEIAEPSRERALPAELPALPYVGLEHIEPQSMRLLGHGYAHEARSSSVRFSRGDVLYGKMRPYLNKVWVAEFDGLCSAEFLVFAKHTGINSQFLALRLNAEDFVTFANGQVSGERPRVDFEKLARFPILLPPVAEQERIVAKVNAAWSGVQRAETASRRAQKRLTRYRAAVLDAAATGELTRTWRETEWDKGASRETGADLLEHILKARRAHWEETELRRLQNVRRTPKDDRWRSRYPEPVSPDPGDLPGLPKEWAQATLDQITTLITKGSSPKWQGFDYRDKGIIFVRSESVRWGSLDLSQVAHLPPAFNRKEKKSILQEGDVLLNLVGASIGRAAVATPEVQGGNVNQAVAVIRLVQKQTMNQFAVLWLISSVAQKRIHSEKVDFARANFSLENTRALPIPIPSLAEQSEIVREANSRLAAADRISAKLERQLELTRSTRQSILREAFAGRLLPQDQKDEPASLLLERIRAARKTEALKPKGKRMSKPKSEMKAAGRRNLLAVLKENGGPMTPEELFRASGHSQESVDQFFAELRELTTPPANIVEERKSGARIVLRAMP